MIPSSQNEVSPLSTGQVSLRDAINLADVIGGDQTIGFASLTGQTITLQSGSLVLDDPSGTLTIDGLGTSLTVDGNGQGTVFQNDPHSSAEIEGLCITGGNARYGGGVDNGGVLTITNSTISGNHASYSGGGVSDVYVAEYRQTVTTIVDSTISGNSAQGYGGGVDAVYNVTITNCTVSNNSALSGGGISGSATVIDSTISDNNAFMGGGVLAHSADPTIINSTITGNSATRGGGLAAYYGSASLTDDTIASNSGEGIWDETGTISLNGSIVAGNLVGGTEQDLSGPTGDFSGTYDLIGDDTGTIVGLTDPSNTLDQNPLLAPLNNYTGTPGSVETMALLPGSPALEASTVFNDSSGNPIETDQRGIARPQGAAPDIGAFESQGFVVTATGSSGTQSKTINTSFSNLTVSVTANDPNLTNLVGGIINFYAPGSGPTATLGTAATLQLSGSSYVTSVTAVANGLIGDYSVYATAAPTVGTPVEFSLNNTLPALPTVSISGPTSVEAGTYTLGLAGLMPSADAGIDSISSWTINWGDGTLSDPDLQVITGNPSTATHPYTFGVIPYVITASANDQFGNSFQSSNSVQVTVSPVSPSATISGSGSVAAGAAYTLNLAATIPAADNGFDSIQSWQINWGDGTLQTLTGNPSSVGHIFAAGYTSATVNATAYDALGFAASALPETVSIVTVPSPWTDSDIGSPALAGSAYYNSTTGTWTVSGSGSDIQYTSDQFNFASETLSGDGSISAEVDSITNTSGWAKSGVMFRDSTDPGAAYAAVFVTPGNGVNFQWRDADGDGTSYVNTGPNGPAWVKVVRDGGAFSGYYSTDGLNWTQIGQWETVTMPTTALAGLAVTAHDDSLLNTSTFNNVVQSLPAPLPSGWADSDIGAPGLEGSASYNSTTGAWTVSGSGSDIQYTSDQFNFASETFSGDGSISAEVDYIMNTDAWAKSGVMFRNSSDPGAAYAAVFVTPGNGVNFQWRDADGDGTSYVNAGPNGPAWVKVVRDGDDFSGYYSTDGLNWTQIGQSETVTMPTTALAGLAVTAHDDSLLNASAFANVLIQPVFTGVPIAPSSLVGTVISPSEIDLTWIDTDPSATLFYVMDQINGGSTWPQIGSVLANQSAGPYSFAATGLNPADQYSFEVVAANSFGQSSPSNVVGPLSLPALLPPQNPAVMLVESNQVSIQWTASTNATDYYVQRLEGTTWTTLNPSGTASTTYTDTTVSPGSTYQYQIIAHDAVGNSAPSSVVSATTPTTPSTFGRLTAVPIDSADIGLAWTDLSSLASGSTIVYTTDPTFSTGLTTVDVPAGTTVLVISNLLASTEYYFELLPPSGLPILAFASATTYASGTSSITNSSGPVAPQLAQQASSSQASPTTVDLTMTAFSPDQLT